MQGAGEHSNRLPLQYAALGLLMAGPRHGYELHGDFVEQFGAIWRAGRSQFYAALKSLEQDDYVGAATIAQESRPPRKVLTIMPAGHDLFLTWLRTPAPHVRQIRVEFLAKLHFYKLLSLDGATDLIDAQIDICAARLDYLQGKVGEALDNDDPFDELVYDFRRRQIGAVIDWLEFCRQQLT